MSVMCRSTYFVDKWLVTVSNGLSGVQIVIGAHVRTIKVSVRYPYGSGLVRKITLLTRRYPKQDHFCGGIPAARVICVVA